jgi:enoyl-CoA hydratase
MADQVDGSKRNGLKHKRSKKQKAAYRRIKIAKEIFMSENVLLESHERIGVIKINRPEVRNAMDPQTMQLLQEALDLWEREQTVQVIVFTGEGNQSFAAGADIRQLQKRTMLDALSPGMQGLTKKIESCTKPTVAAINGFALGGGCELALACDIRIAANNAKLGLPELNLGIIPGAGGTQRLARIIGKGRAIEMILTGKIIGAEEAEKIGLVSRTIPYEQLWDEVKETANQIISKGPIALRLAKMVIHRGFDVDLDTALILEKLAQSIAYGSEDKVEGTQAFLEKRKANFKNK